MYQTGPGSYTGFLPDRGPVSNPDRAETQTGKARQTLEENGKRLCQTVTGLRKPGRKSRGLPPDRLTHKSFELTQVFYWKIITWRAMCQTEARVCVQSYQTEASNLLSFNDLCNIRKCSLNRGLIWSEVGMKNITVMVEGY